MTWIDWAVLIWALCVLVAVALVGYWTGLHVGEKRARRELAPRRPYVTVQELMGPQTAPQRAQRAVPTDTSQIPVQRLDTRA